MKEHLFASSGGNELLMAQTQPQIFWKCPIEIVLDLTDANFRITLRSDSSRIWKFRISSYATSHDESAAARKKC
jgi:hypothetical protein